MSKHDLTPFRFWIGDWFDGWPFGETKWTYQGQWVDTSKYDIVPKREYVEKLAKEKDKELQELDEWYEKRKQKLLAEKKGLAS